MKLSKTYVFIGDNQLKTYHKIHTIFKRNPATKFKTILPGEYSLPEFEYLKDNNWIFTEKVDGTNIRVMKIENGIEFGGKSDNAQIPAPLVKFLQDKFLNNPAFSDFPIDTCLYGEGYGPKIQKIGGKYRDSPSFVLFDVKIGDWWLKREDVEDIAIQFCIDFVPVVGQGTLQDAVNMVKNGMKSMWGDFQAEGLVLRPEIELSARNGERIITKIKCRDYE